MQNKPHSPSMPQKGGVDYHAISSGCRVRGESSSDSVEGSPRGMDYNHGPQRLPPSFMLPPPRGDEAGAASIYTRQEHQRYSPSQGNSSHFGFRDPLVVAQETDNAMTALASARRLPSTRLTELLSYAQPSCNGFVPHANSASRGLQQPMDHFNRLPDPPIELANEYGSPRHKTSDSHRIHPCQYCSKKFGRPSALKIHLSMHTGEKPFLCPEDGCNRSFSVRSNMSRHVRIVHHKGQSQDELDEEVGERQE